MGLKFGKRSVLCQGLPPSLFFLFLSGVFLLIINFYRDFQRIPSDHSIGNRLSHVNALKESGLPFSFLVIGDTKATETAETLMKGALKRENSSFMVILGDFVTMPDLWNHRFFLTEMTQEIEPPFPVFLVSGNHDIDFGTKIKQERRRVTPQVYESLYGARNFDFIFNDCLFIISGIDPKKPDGYLDYLQDVLSKKAGGKRHIFIFSHIPPKGLIRHMKGARSDIEKLLNRVKLYKGVTCFFGDYHGYFRGQYNGINLIVSGGGGGRLKGFKWGEFHHILKVTVNQEILTEEIITIRGKIGLEDRFEKFIFMTLFPIIQESGWVLYVIFFIFLIISVWTVFRLFKKIQPNWTG